MIYDPSMIYDPPKFSDRAVELVKLAIAKVRHFESKTKTPEAGRQDLLRFIEAEREFSWQRRNVEMIFQKMGM